MNTRQHTGRADGARVTESARGVTTASVRRGLSSVWLAMALLCYAVGASGADRSTHWMRLLATGDDFRVRVQAALQLGKTTLRRTLVRKSLVAALDDSSTAVRAAAAAGLKSLGDPAAIPMLEELLRDDSAAVRAQAEGSIAALRLRQTAAEPRAETPPQVLVLLGRVRVNARPSASEIQRAFKRRSRLGLKQLGGVRVIEDPKRAQREIRLKRLPVVLLTGHVRKLRKQKRGDRIVYFARVEYVLHRMPGQLLTGQVSGFAQVSGDYALVKDRKQLRALRISAVKAAVDSALRQAPQALLAASR